MSRLDAQTVRRAGCLAGWPFAAAFVALAEARSGVSLADFFDVWLFEPRKPSAW